MAALLNTSSIMMCPHGGTVSVVTTNTQVKGGGDPLIGATDTYMIGPSPHPCLQVQWVQPDLQSQVLGDFTLNEESVGLCVAADLAVQGTVLINFTQEQVSGL
jgi:hypothetical protein